LKREKRACSSWHKEESRRQPCRLELLRRASSATGSTTQKACLHLWIKKNSFYFGNALGTSMNVRVPIWNDLFGSRSFQVRTAISHHAIPSLKTIVSVAIREPQPLVR